MNNKLTPKKSVVTFGYARFNVLNFPLKIAVMELWLFFHIIDFKRQVDCGNSRIAECRKPNKAIHDSNNKAYDMFNPYK